MRQPYRLLTLGLALCAVAAVVGAFILLDRSRTADVGAEVGKWLFTVAAALVLTGALSMVVKQIDQRRSERQAWHGILNDLDSLLFGTFLGINRDQVAALLAVAAVTVVLTFLAARPLFFASVDPDTAQASGVPVRLLSFGFLLVLGLSVAETSQITGALLVFALLVTPAATAHQLTARPWLGITLSVALALAVTWLGLTLAFFSIYPVGFYITSLSFAPYAIVRLARAARGPRANRLVPAKAS